jgi:hypothetical protein
MWMMAYLLVCVAVFCFVLDCVIEYYCGEYKPQMPEPPDLDDD